ncbi:MAG: hypothetical protein EOS85_11670 [Mesorhizobium sp.]|nr:MAG: hypothetical protein EOS85_11670 [Mesorhizobium sp.]
MPLTLLIDSYCAAWSDENAQQRRALLSSVWSDGATYTDPTVHATGAEELLAHIAGVLAKHPGAASYGQVTWMFIMGSHASRGSL